MIKIDFYKPSDFETVKSFVESIQEHERINVPELESGAEIGTEYTKKLIDTVAAQQGLILLARAASDTVGFACAWIEEDDDMLLSEDVREHAYISDIFVNENYRRRGIAQLLLKEIEKEMKSRGCERIRICTKASNLLALKCYEASGYSQYEIILTKPLTD